MDASELLDKFVKYAELDKEEKVTYVGSARYELSNAGNVIKKTLGRYDRTGNLSVMFAENAFTSVCRNMRVSVMDLLSGKTDYEREKEMFEAFREMKRLKEDYLSTIQRVYARIGGSAPVSEITEELMLDKLSLVVSNMAKLHVDCWKKAGKVQRVTKLCQDVCMFDTMAECVITMERQDPGIYLCFIAAGGTANCYFEIMVNDGAGNLYGFCDRVNEAFLGQHAHARNARWTEDKNEIFPYDYCFSYDGYDYKGYATHYHFNDYRKLGDLDLGALVPLIMLMLHVQDRYEGMVIDRPVHYSSLLIGGLGDETQRKAAERNEIVKAGESEIVEATRQIRVDMSLDELTDPKTAEAFSYKNEKRDDAWYDNQEYYEAEYGYYENQNHDLIEEYADGFAPISAEALFRPCAKALEDKDGKDGEYVPEMIGTEKRLRKEAYHQNRKVLANHLKERMKEDIEANGGEAAIVESYVQKIKGRCAELETLCAKTIRKALEAKEGGEAYSVRKDEAWAGVTDHLDVSIQMEKDSVHKNSAYRYLNAVMMPDKSNDNWRRPCDPETGNECSLVVQITALDAEGLAWLCGESAKNLPGYVRAKRMDWGNSLLDSTDYVAAVSSPFFDTRERDCKIWVCLAFTKTRVKKIVRKEEEKS